MSDGNHDWIVFHRVCFSEPVNGRNNPFPAPKHAICWRFYPQSVIGPDGFTTNIAKEWAGFSLYPSRALAERTFDDPDGRLALTNDAEESFHALAMPIAHRGEVNWRGAVRQDDSFAVAAYDDGGPLVVMTSAGYKQITQDDVPRAQNFLRKVDAVIEYYRTLPGNVCAEAYTGINVDGGDGITLSFWQDDTAMIAAAYKPGNHRDQIDHHSKSALFDRSSFTRARILAAKGTWNGSDLMALMC